MSQHRFTALTAEFLVRRGEATPPIPDAKTRIYPATQGEFAGAGAAVRTPGSHAQTERPAKLVALKSRGDGTLPPSRGTRKLVVRVSQQDYERLGLAAVKRDTSRSEIVRQAMDSCLQELTREFRNSCACISPKE